MEGRTKQAPWRGKAFFRTIRNDPNWPWVVRCRLSGVSTPGRHDEVGDAKSAYRISRFSRCPGEGEPIRWRFCLWPLKSVAKRVLFSCRAASAKVCIRSKTQILESYILKLIQMVTPTFLRFTCRE